MKAEESMRPLVYGCALGGEVKGVVVGAWAIGEVVDKLGRADSCGCFQRTPVGLLGGPWLDCVRHEQSRNC